MRSVTPLPVCPVIIAKSADSSGGEGEWAAGWEVIPTEDVVEVDDTVVCRCCPGLEMVGDSKRTLAGSVYQMFWPVGVFILTGVAYLLRDWSHLQLAMACPTVLFLSCGL